MENGGEEDMKLLEQGEFCLILSLKIEVSNQREENGCLTSLGKALPLLKKTRNSQLRIRRPGVYSVPESISVMFLD